MRLRNFIILVLSLLVISACSDANEVNNNDENTSQDDVQKQEEDEDAIEVDKGLLNVEITLPEMFFEDENMDEMIEEAKEEGIKDVTQNEDGTVTFKMSKKDHKEMLRELEENVKETVEDIKNDEEFASIVDVTYNKSFTEFTIIADREGFENSFDGFAILGVGMSGTFYQLFSGEDMQTSEVTVFVEDEATGEVFEEITYTEAFEDIEN